MKSKVGKGKFKLMIEDLKKEAAESELGGLRLLGKLKSEYALTPIQSSLLDLTLTANSMFKTIEHLAKLN